MYNATLLGTLGALRYPWHRWVWKGVHTQSTCNTSGGRFLSPDVESPKVNPRVSFGKSHDFLWQIITLVKNNGFLNFLGDDVA